MIRAAVIPVDEERAICLSCELPECDESSSCCRLAHAVSAQLQQTRREYRDRKRARQGQAVAITD